MCGKPEGEGIKTYNLFPVDDLKCSHKKKTVNDDFAKWLEKTYGQHGKVKVHQGKVHEYIGMKLDYSEEKNLKIDIRDYVMGWWMHFL